MKSLDAIILDDEELGRKNLQNLLSDYCPEVRVLGLAKSPLEARRLFHKYQPKLVFVDIHMPEGTGFDFLNGFRTRSFSTIFVTAYRDYGIEALKAGAVDYLLKPVDFRELQIAVDKAMTQQFASTESQQNARILIHSAEGSFVLPLSEVVFVRAASNYSEIVLVSGKVRVVSMTLKKVQEVYDMKNFNRVSNSILVNLEHVLAFTNVGGKQVEMSSGESLIISRRRYADFVAAMEAFTL